MKVNGIQCIFLCLVTSVIRTKVTSKSLYSNKFGLNRRLYPIKRIAPNPIPYAGDITDDFTDDLTSSKFESNQGQRKLGASGLRLNSELGRKRSSIENTLDLKTETVRKRNLFTDTSNKEEEPYGVVFSHGKAIGVLKPFVQSYELSSFEEEKQPLTLLEQDSRNLGLPNKREVTDNSEGSLETDHIAKYSDMRYPEILANFKIGNKLNALRQGQENKRENPYMKKIENMKTPIKVEKRSPTEAKVHQDDKRYISSNDLTKETESINEASTGNIDEIENNLRGVINELGLTSKEDEAKEKRSIEDEDLELGANRINLKREHILTREKKEDKDSTESSTAKTIKREVSSDISVKTEGDDKKIMRSKRQEKNSIENDSDDIIKGLEASGDLTVSGNKSPLAATSNEHEVNARETTKNEESDIKDKRDNERQIEDNLQQKINAIKEEVKREFNELKTNGKTDNEASLRTKRGTEDKSQGTLIDEENDALVPELNSPQGLEPHIRSKRMLETQIARDKVIVENAESERIHAKKRIHKRDTSATTEKSDSQECPGGHTMNKDEKQGDASSEKGDSNKEISRLQRSNKETKKPVEVASKSDQSREKNEAHNMDDQDVSAKSSDEKSTECPGGKVKRDSSSTASSIIKKEKKDSVVATAKRKRHAGSFITRHGVHQKHFEEVPMVYTRRKRANALVPDGNMAYVPYRSEDDEVDDESDEFDDDGFDDRSSTLVRKRREQEYFNAPMRRRPSEEYDELNDDDYDYYYQRPNHLVKRESLARNYVNSLNEDSDQNDNYLYSAPEGYVRKKRQSLDDDLSAIHSGAATELRLANAKERYQYPLRQNYRMKRLQKNLNTINANKMKKYENNGELVDSDLFGALPQSYEGELSRFKRVKRSSATSTIK